MNSMKTAARTVLSKYATFSGRASRSEFWWWILAVFIVLIICQLIDGALILPLLGFEAFQAEGGTPLSVIVSLLVILPNIAVAVRRLHDTGRVGWWLLIGLVPVIGALILIYFYVQPSEEETNQFGPPQPFS
ncbi:DUF805 domain-containing protein [Tateyamaria sp.]|uniref:DUF805 domain-containing protein n=1 Tax=Tateyamaria sp. TaxID=1929288 RepID=UPI0032A119D2